MATTSARLSGSGRAWPAVLVVVVVAALAVGVYLWTTGKGQKPAAPAPIGLWPGGVSLPPLPEKWRAVVQAAKPDDLVWADRIRKVYEALGPGPQQAMLSKGEYVFRLADLPKAQADTVREYFQQNEDARGWAESKVGSPPDLSKITLKFARSGDGEFVSFVRQAPNGDYSNLMIGAWPGSQQGR